MVRVFGHQHLCQQPAGRDALVDEVRRHRRLDQCLTLGARPFAAHMAFHSEDARLAIEFLGNVFADALQLATAVAGRRLRLVTDLAARQVRRQRRAPGLFPLALVRSGRRQLFNFPKVTVTTTEALRQIGELYARSRSRFVASYPTSANAYAKNRCARCLTTSKSGCAPDC